MEIKPIRTKADHRAALKEIETFMNAKAGTPEGERLDVVATLVEAYERKHWGLERKRRAADEARQALGGGAPLACRDYWMGSRGTAAQYNSAKLPDEQSAT